ncbi:MAG: signal peptide peptidase SppA [Actinobacteria bacterium]|nr:signal peptide peptidase SppA [Actinomycetota bacterium]MBE3114185.1 signal peptide peptidase SppA [Actinomycetota bacterium]
MARWSAGKIVGITFLCIFVLFMFSGGCFFIGLFSGSFGRTAYNVGESVYEIRLEGVISGEKFSSLLSGETVTPEEIIGQLDEADKNPNVKAILLRVNSPGGSPAASQEIYEEIKKMEKPVVVSVSDTCASGAYYVASAADRIIANRSSSVGSIGVIMQIPNYEDLYEKLGLKYTTIKQGKYKDIGSPDRPLTKEEMKLLEAQLKEIYRQFISDVAEARSMDVSEVEELATGWVFLGTEALELGLIDDIGNYKDAINIAAELGGIKGEPIVIRQKISYSLMDLILGYYLNSAIGKIF